MKLLGFVSILLLCLLAACGEEAGSGTTTSTRVAQWDRLDLPLPLAVDQGNPFNPAEVQVDVELTAPSGSSIVIPAFVGRAFQRALVDNHEVLTPAGELRWQARFTPTEIGLWHWRWRRQRAAAVDVGNWQSFEATPPHGDQHGFIRRSQRDTRYLEFDDGHPYWALGENLSWYAGQGTFDYDRWIADLKANGCNYIRLWMPSWAFAPEWIERDSHGAVAQSSLGNYERRLDRLWQLDHVIETAERQGMYVMLSLFNHGAFSLDFNSEWADNPYNVANGGPLAQPRDFFTNPQAIELVRRRLRYIAARWGYSPNIMSWELWNEVDLADHPTGGEVEQWHQQMGDLLRQLDPNDHLISTSLATRYQLLNLWKLDNVDFTQLHLYSFAGIPLNFTELVPVAIGRLARNSKPVLFGEGGVDSRGPAETIANDPNADGFHDILWSGLTSESFGSGMSWWWDNVVEPQNLYSHFAPLAALTKGVDFAGEGFGVQHLSSTAGSGQSVNTTWLVGRNTVLAWIKNAGHQWTAPDPSPVSGAVLTLPELPAGAWTATWIDTRTNAHTTAGAIAAATIEVPVFERDTALRLDRR